MHEISKLYVLAKYAYLTFLKKLVQETIQKCYAHGCYRFYAKEFFV